MKKLRKNFAAFSGHILSSFEYYFTVGFILAAAIAATKRAEQQENNR